jgi:hypothetical protein
MCPEQREDSAKRRSEKNENPLIREGQEGSANSGKRRK